MPGLGGLGVRWVPMLGGSPHKAAIQGPTQLLSDSCLTPHLPLDQAFETRCCTLMGFYGLLVHLKGILPYRIETYMMRVAPGINLAVVYSCVRARLPVLSVPPLTPMGGDE